VYIKIAAVNLYSEDEYILMAASFNGRFPEHLGSMKNFLQGVLDLAGSSDSARFQTDTSNIFIRISLHTTFASCSSVS